MSSSICTDFNPSAPPQADEMPEHSGRVFTNGGDHGSHPGDSVLFPLHNNTTSSTTTCSNRSSASPTPACRSDSPVDEGYALNAVTAGTSSHSSIGAQRSYPFLFTPQQHTYPFFTESEKLRKLRLKKERNQNKKEKNVKSTFKVRGDSEADFNLEEVLESLGEQKAAKKTKNGHSSSSSSNPVVISDSNSKPNKNRKRSNGTVVVAAAADSKLSNDESSSKANSSDEERKTKVGSDEKTKENGGAVVKVVVAATAKQPPRDLSGSRVVLSSVGSNNSSEQPGDLKRQTSKSTENLSFTKVMTKKKWKKKCPSTDEENNQAYQQRTSQQQQSFPSYENRRSTSGYNLRSRNGGDQQQHQHPAGHDSSRSSSTSHSEKSSFPIRGSPEQLKQQQQSASLDLTVDFPPLGPEENDLQEQSLTSSSPYTNSSFAAAPVWPVMKSSDPTAVIDKSDDTTTATGGSVTPTEDEPPNTPTSSTEGKMGSGPPDITLPARSGISNAAQSTLPDVAAQAPIDGAASSGENTPPFTSSASAYEHHHHHHHNNQISASSSTCPGRDDSSLCGRDLSSRNSTASFFVDTENNVEIVLTEEEYNRRREIGAAPVVILGKGDTPLEDWSTSPELEFGFELNESLLLTGGSSDLYYEHQHQHKAPLMDGAIVSLGESGDSLAHLLRHPIANLHEQGKDRLLFSSSSSRHAPDDTPSGRSTPKAAEEQDDALDDDTTTTECCPEEDEEEDERTVEEESGYNHANYVQIISMVSKRWKSVEKELKSNAQNVVYYHHKGRGESAQV